jgi:pimeloyl-ACP methyl ester carboxylesterase
LPALLASFGLRKACLYGHSDGGSIALIAAARRDDLVEAVIAEAPHVFAEAKTIAGVRDMAGRFETDPAFRRKIVREHQLGARPFQLWCELWLSLGEANWNIGPDIGTSDVPLLLIQGLDDPFGSTAHVETVAAQNRQAVVRIVPNTGHSIHRTEASLPFTVAAFLSGPEQQDERAPAD